MENAVPLEQQMRNAECSAALRQMLNSEFGMLNDGDGRGRNVKNVACGHEKRECAVAQMQCR